MADFQFRGVGASNHTDKERVKECEDELVYKTEELAKQKFNNFTGA